MDKKMTVVLPVISCLLFSGCDRIFEDRMPCPCYLTLDISGCDSVSVKNLNVWLFSASGKLLRRDTLCGREYGKTYRVPVVRGLISCYVWGNIGKATGVEDALSPEARLSKREGWPADSLFFYGNRINTAAEEAFRRVSLRKEFITAEVILKGKTTDRENIRLEIFCPGEGLQIEGSPFAGEGNIIAYPAEQSGPGGGSAVRFTFRILRQKSCKGIHLKITKMNSNVPTVLKEYPLGGWLEANGYDMGAANLQDIKIEMDFSASAVTVGTEDWKTTYPAHIKF